MPRLFKFFLLFALTAAGGPLAAQNTAIKGTWTAELHNARVFLQVRTAPPADWNGDRWNGDWNMGQTFPVEELTGLPANNDQFTVTSIKFDLPVASRVKVEVFDLFGRRIRTLSDQQWPAGYHQVEWDRRDASGNALRSGVFMYRMVAGSFTDRKKMVIIGE